MKDQWCKPLIRDGKVTISGGAARNVRIKSAGGMDEILAHVVTQTLRYVDQMAGHVGPINNNLEEIKHAGLLGKVGYLPNGGQCHMHH